MTKDDFILIEHMVQLKVMGMSEKDEMQRLIRTYLDKGFSMCMTCEPQVRQAFKRLCDWWKMKRNDFYNELFVETKKTKKKDGNS